MMSQFDDRLITGYGKTMTGLKKFDFYNPNPNFAKTFTNGKTTTTGLSLHWRKYGMLSWYDGHNTRTWQTDRQTELLY